MDMDMEGGDLDYSYGMVILSQRYFRDEVKPTKSAVRLENLDTLLEGESWILQLRDSCSDGAPASDWMNLGAGDEDNMTVNVTCPVTGNIIG